MSLRRRLYLSESEVGDRAARSRALGFYGALVDFVNKKPKRLRKRGGGELYVFAEEFWDDEEAKRFSVVFAPELDKQGHRVLGGLGSAGGIDVLYLACLIAPGDPRYLSTRINRDTVVHEMIHFFDSRRRKKGETKRSAKMGVGTDDYYNHPSEWNAYWQEGASQFERLLGNPGIPKGSPQFEVFFGNGSFKDVQKRVGHFWNKQFLDAMSQGTKRKFDKRLYRLWANLGQTDGVYNKVVKV